MLKSAFHFAILVAVGGCSSFLGPHSDRVELTPAKPIFTVGEPVTARLSNGSGDQIGYGACALRAERHQGADWVLAGPSQVGCTMQLIVLGPNSERMLELRIGTPLIAGEYRLLFYYTPDTRSPDKPLYSPSFTVEAQ
jgi:hypothetical protein